ncbi:MAG: hypothetical protein KTR25_13620 [Myxococcales bacterium]|nr:hypothetical protein [Myxococcales bacterium]
MASLTDTYVQAERIVDRMLVSGMHQQTVMEQQALDTTQVAGAISSFAQFWYVLICLQT